MKYRAEIDGLRALAVVPVILFHAGFGLFSGGFVGVDVFFVISGYLITTLLIEDIENNRFSIVHFYERRARRILPALFIVMLVCIPFAWVWMLPNQMKDFSRSLVAVSLFASNIRFWQDSGYFAAGAEEKPLLHTWSLAVEEQYYVLFPIFLFFACRFGKNRVFWIIVVLAAISLALSEWGWRSDASANFYLAPTRAWELFAGSIAAFVIRKRGVQANNVLSLLGLAAIIFAIFAYDESTPFPSIYALVPVIGVVLLVLFAEKDTLAAKLLSTKLLVGIGLVSYSVYLWHQPLFVFARVRSLDAPSASLMLSLSAMSIILGVLSWKIVEQPFRRKSQFSRRFIFSVSLSFGVVFIFLGMFIEKTDVFENLFVKGLNEDLQKVVGLVAFAKDKDPDFVEKWQYGKCFYGDDLDSFSFYNKEQCLRLDPSRKNVLLVGDSHAAQWYFALKQNYQNVNVLQATASGCRPLIGTDGDKRCTDLREYIFNEFLPQNPIDAVIISARWREEEVTKSLRNTIDYLRNFSKNIYVIGPTVEYYDALPYIYLKFAKFEGGNKYEQNFSQINVESWVDTKIFSLSEVIESLTIESKAYYVSVVDLVCSGEKCSSLTPAGKLMAFDHGHLTLDGSDYIVKLMKDRRLLIFD